MTSANWVFQFLKANGVADIFGLPGAVILDFLYAADAGRPDVVPHLCYHEQGGAMEACGYAQSTGRIGVAYATRGPGFTNMLTAIADAYYDSIPVMFFSAHSGESLKPGMRAENNQEIDTVALASGITKYAIRIDRAKDIPTEVARAYEIAMSGRKGPVFLDILSSALQKEVAEPALENDRSVGMSDEYAAQVVSGYIRNARRPVLLIGNGVRQAGMQAEIRVLAETAGIPVLSSRAAQDIMPDSELYFGHIGSHGTRYGNFILSKADVLIALGNRLSFPVKSASFRPVVENAAVIRVETDPAEFQRTIPGSVNIQSDLRTLLPAVMKADYQYENRAAWLAVCRELRERLWQWDSMPIVDALGRMMRNAGEKTAFVCDVGNHGFWVTNAYAYSGVTNRIMYSNAFGTLGSGLPKAIGACCGLRQPVVCFSGDQGFQMNLQELALISQERLPISVVILNNESSGMIMEREQARFGEHMVHTTKSSGYTHPDFEQLAKAYGIQYRRVESPEQWDDDSRLNLNEPSIIEFKVDIGTKLYPNLPRGNICQDLIPPLPRELYEQMEDLR